MPRAIVTFFLLISLAAYARPESAESGVRVVELPLEGSVPDAERGPDGALHVAFVADSNLYYSKSTDGGKTFSSPLQVNLDRGNVHGGRYRGPDLTVDGDGRVHVVWYNNGYQRSLPQDQWGVEYARLAPGESSFSGRRNLNHLPSDNYSVAADSRGRVAVFWTAEGLFTNLSTDGGDSFGEAVRVGEGGIDPCECCATRCQFTADGRLYLTYREKADNLRDMHLVEFPDIFGKTGSFTRSKISGETWKIDLCPMTGSWLAPLPDGGLTAAWDNRTTVEFASFGPDGRMQGSALRTAVDKGLYPVILQNAAGEILVAWKWKSELFWKLYRNLEDQSPKTGSFAGKDPDRPAGVVTAEGDFLLFP